MPRRGAGGRFVAGKVKFITNLPGVRGYMMRMGEAAVAAAAMVITNQAKLNARGGFKGGAFVTRGWQGIRWKMVKKAAVPTARIGHHELHFMLWEMGHHNLCTRQYERHPWLEPALRSTRDAQGIAANKAARQVTIMAGTALGAAAGSAVQRMAGLVGGTTNVARLSTLITGV